MFIDLPLRYRGIKVEWTSHVLEGLVWALWRVLGRNYLKRFPSSNRAMPVKLHSIIQVIILNEKTIVKWKFEVPIIPWTNIFPKNNNYKNLRQKHPLKYPEHFKAYTLPKTRATKNLDKGILSSTQNTPNIYPPEDKNYKNLRQKQQKAFVLYTKTHYLRWRKIIQMTVWSTQNTPSPPQDKNYKNLTESIWICLLYK